MLDVHNNRAPSNIMNIFVRTLNNSTNTCSSTSQPQVSKSGMRCLMNRKICQRNPSKRNKKVHLNILGTENSSIKPDEIMVKFKHCKIETN